MKLLILIAALSSLSAFALDSKIEEKKKAESLDQDKKIEQPVKSEVEKR